MSAERIRFLCVHDWARSQMAEGLLRHLGGDRFAAFSAGAAATRARPLTIAARAEPGIDIGWQESETLDRCLGERFDAVITACEQANEDGPIFPGATRHPHRSFDDPSNATGTQADQLAT